MADPISHLRPTRVADVSRRERRLWRLQVALLVIAVVFLLDYAQQVLLPIALGILLAFLLAPLVRWLKRLWIPEPVGAALVLLALIGGLVSGVYLLAGPASRWMAEAPDSLRQVERKLRDLEGPMEQMSEAAESVERLTRVGEGEEPPEVKIRAPGLGESLLSGTGVLVGTGAVILVLLYFLLASGDFIHQKFLRHLGSSSARRRTADLSRQIERQVGTYLLGITTINICLGLVIAGAMALMGLPTPLLWGALATVLNFIPYLGALTGVAVITVVGLLSFDSPAWALATAAVYGTITGLEGGVVTPWILGRRLALNPVAVFLSLILWGWLWGVPGALLAVPLMATFKIISDQLPPLRPVGEFLGR